MKLQIVVAAVALLVFATSVRADGPKDNLPEQVRPVPPQGTELPEPDKARITQLLTELSTLIEQLHQPAKNQHDTALRQRYLPDVEIFYKAGRDALKYGEIFDKNEAKAAVEQVEQGIERARALLIHEVSWLRSTGLVVRGYRSKIDGSVQPYGLLIPDGYNSTGGKQFRLDIWCHGRGETLSELNFIRDRMHQVGRIQPPDAIVLHPYGRYCNAFKFAGEVDVLEALEAVRADYRIDPERVVMRGFSMGGAACWQFAVHYPDWWVAATPGAGFSETADFLKVYQQEKVQPTWYEKKLWHLYDCTDYAVNLFECPTIAYIGELDSQKQAADMMEKALSDQGIDLVHLIGPKTKHDYHPESLKQIEQLLASIVEKGRERYPRTIRFSTYTLKYNGAGWVTIDGLDEHWNEARIHAQTNPRPGSNDKPTVTAKTSNISDLTFSYPAGWCPFDITQPVHVVIDGQTVEGPQPGSDRSWQCRLHQIDGTWKYGARPADPKVVRKRHNLQGPIDDAFMDSFVFVRPTGKSQSDALHRWSQAEMEHAIVHWRKQFRGEARVVEDSQVNDAIIANANLVLWGDPSSNAILHRIADKLPIRWEQDQIVAGDRKFSTSEHGLILIAPNPLNPNRYVVLNSGFTYREYDYLNNARQVPKLPDWAVVDLRTKPDSRFPGKVVAADFFDEEWKLRPPHDDSDNGSNKSK
ncbi:MAG TPA: prolyl oligopeptidase family serine peptidase [Planctomycetaceae bacterium]|nr:prolyl oligopeptidase family serine peptidase [Planctomycetaceae bacterium]